MCQAGDVYSQQWIEKESDMQTTRVAVDIAKNVPPVHGADHSGRPVKRPQFRRAGWLKALTEKLEPGCEIDTETHLCESGHFTHSCCASLTRIVRSSTRAVFAKQIQISTIYDLISATPRNFTLLSRRLLPNVYRHGFGSLTDMLTIFRIIGSMISATSSAVPCPTVRQNAATPWA